MAPADGGEGAPYTLPWAAGAGGVSYLRVSILKVDARVGKMFDERRLDGVGGGLDEAMVQVGASKSIPIPQLPMAVTLFYRAEWTSAGQIGGFGGLLTVGLF